MEPLDPRELPPVPTEQARRARANRERHFDRRRRSRAYRSTRQEGTA